MFDKDSKTVILMEKGHLHDAEEEKTIKFKDFPKNCLLRELANQNLGNWIRFMLIKVKIHTLSHDLRRNL
jgi:hypothetical protein